MAVLDKVKRQVRWALETAPKLAPKGLSPAFTSPGEMWIVANGFSNAFYSIRETLRNVEIQGDPILRHVYKEWWGGGVGQEFDLYLGNFRNALTHQGIFNLESLVTWEIDHDHDREIPKFSYPFTRVQYPDSSTRDFTFPEWVHFCFEWWERQLRELERLYIEAGGNIEAPPDLDWGWDTTNRDVF